VAGRNNSRVIVIGHVAIGTVDGWVVETGLGDASLEIVRNQLRRHATEEIKGTHVARYPIRQALYLTGLNIGVTGRPQRRDKDLGRTHLAGFGADNIHGVARIVDKQALTGRVTLTHHRRQLAFPTSVEFAVPAMAVRIRANTAIHLPQQRKRQTLRRYSACA